MHGAGTNIYPSLELATSGTTSKVFALMFRQQVGYRYHEMQGTLKLNAHMAARVFVSMLQATNTLISNRYSLEKGDTVSKLLCWNLSST